MTTSDKRIGIFIPDLTGGGAERAMLKLGAGLARLGYTVDLMVSNASGAYLTQIPESVTFRDLKAGQPRSSVPALSQYLKSERPIALISALHNANVAALIAQRLSGTSIPVILSIQNNYSSERTLATSRRDKIEVSAPLLFYRFAAALVGVSQGVADDIAQAVPVRRSRVSVIYNPIVSSEMRARSVESVDHPWFAPGEPPVILGVGRLHPQKDFPMLIRAFATVRRNRPARLMILGQGDERAALEKLVEDLGLQDDVLMPGFAANPYAYMHNAALFALSSRHEGLPTVLIEALASGCPVVSTNCPDGPDEILKDGLYGALTPVGDAETFATAILEALAKPKALPPDESWTPYSEQNCAEKFSQLVGKLSADRTA